MKIKGKSINHLYGEFTKIECECGNEMSLMQPYGVEVVCDECNKKSFVKFK